MNDTKKNPHAVALGRLGGLAGAGVTTPKKARAAKRNGKLGGRPKHRTDTAIKSYLRKKWA